MTRVYKKNNRASRILNPIRLRVLRRFARSAISSLSEEDKASVVKKTTRFVKKYWPKKIGKLAIVMKEATFEAKSALSLMEQTPYGGFKPLFDARFLVDEAVGRHTRVITDYLTVREAQLQRAFPNRKKTGDVCFVRALNSSKPGIAKTLAEKAQEVRVTLGEPWQNLLLRELIEHSKKMGLSGVALLRPEYNRSIIKGDVNTPEKQRALGAYYAAARKLGFRKIAESEYMWLVFEK